MKELINNLIIQLIYLNKITLLPEQNMFVLDSQEIFQKIVMTFLSYSTLQKGTKLCTKEQLSV